MKQEPLIPEAQDLDAILNHQPPAGPSIDPQDAAAAKEVLRLAEGGLPVDNAFYHQLEQKLQVAAQRRRPFSNVWVPVLSSIAGGAFLLALLWFSAPLLQQMLGRPMPTPTARGIAGPAVTHQTLTPTPEITPSPQAAATVEPTQPAGSGWMLKAALPEGPRSVPLYLQTSSGDPLTPQSAQAMAGRLGVNGAVYQYQGEGGGTTYLVSDGKSSVLFFGATTQEFTFSSSFPPGNERPPLPFDQQSRIAEEWLKSHGLADFPHHLQPVLTDPYRVMVLRDLESGSQYIQNAYDPSINLTINPDGQVTQVVYRPLNTEISGSLDLRPAAEAWSALQSGGMGKALFYQTLDFSSQRSLKQWFPTYTPGEKTDVYGYASVIQPIDPAQPPDVTVGNLPLTGDPALLSQLQMRKFLHVWGVYRVDDPGHAWLELQGWEVSPLPDLNRGGQLVQDSSGIQFKTEQGELYSVLNLPPSVPQGVNLDLVGVEVSPGQVAWSSIQTQVGDENNQTFGTLPLVDAPAGPDQPPLPETGYQPGDKVEGLEGTSRSTSYQEADGSKTLERMIMVQGWFARLVGAGAEGIEKYQSLPVKVWGTYQVDGSNIVIQVDRFEPAWPDVQIRAYFGTASEKVLEGKNVFILTEDTGQQWVIQSSINFPQSLANQGWDSTTQLAVEGYPSPDKATYAGLPVLIDLSQAMLGIKGTTKENYQMYTNQIQVEERPAGSFVLPKTAVVEQVDLVYFAESFRGPEPQAELARRLQPLWRFNGHLEDGRAFEVLVRAAK